MHRLSEIDPANRTAICSVCGPGDIRLFHRSKNSRGNDYWRCENVVRAERAAFVLKRRGGNIYRHDRRTRAERVAQSEAQGWRCAICKEKVLLVGDHNHETGQPRGMLCRQCNVMIGMAHENPATLLAAVEYLKKYLEL